MKKFTTDNPYLKDQFIVKQYGESKVKIMYCNTLREAGWEDLREKKAYKRGEENDEKLSQSLTRSRTCVREYVLCNPWDWWCTFTINPENYDRYDLDVFYKDFAKFINNYNSKTCDCEEHKVKYLLVPEQHEDGAWHMHGFIKGIRPEDLYINQYGYQTWKQYEKKFGFISMSEIKNIEKAASYAIKYMTKNADKNVQELNKHMYYCSKGLHKAVELFRGRADYLSDKWDWEHPEGFCKIKTLDVNKDDIHDYIKVHNEISEDID